ncbi:DUF3785 family protein [Clostridium sp. SM-530-WT-3G]|uniref:DUF3785 family protein n=1 Tax=Clostridium sp. SM-530-WT-3G TaxID=2725303 RepID=UPI00145E0E1E|nr:DUF3785 family protein [Clostridium sp. SM-530-WT-3G]NME84149.1 DUF3785 family protein [Clostridium sp. SM-530-WT-3G]
MEYKFNYKDKEYVLSEANCEGIFFNEEEIEGFDLNAALKALNEGEEVIFSKEYYSGKCSCDAQEPAGKYYCYLEYHFYIFTKDNKYIISTISEDYRDKSFNKLFSIGKVDKSYIVNVTVCPECNNYSIEVEECDV